jgi:tRNA(adenine34) deaminase
LKQILKIEEKYMRQALREADKAEEKGEVPVGCVIVLDGQIIARGHNLREAKNDPTAHAEIVALRKAGKKLGTWRLEQAIIYVTCEPCAMCAGALVLARVKKVVYGCRDPKAGAVETLYEIGRDGRLNHQFELIGGVLEQECQLRLSRFFQKLRK